MENEQRWCLVGWCSLNASPFVALTCLVGNVLCFSAEFTQLTVFGEKRERAKTLFPGSLCQSEHCDAANNTQSEWLKCQLFMVCHNLVGELAIRWPSMGSSRATSAYMSVGKGRWQTSFTRDVFIFRVQDSSHSRTRSREVCFLRGGFKRLLDLGEPKHMKDLM